MSRTFRVLSCSLVLLFATTSQGQPTADALDKKVAQLLAQMTLEEKVGQMAQITVDVIGKGKNRYTADEPFEIDSAKLRKAVVDFHVGSILNAPNTFARTPAFWNKIIGQIQEAATRKTRLGIPVIYGIDAMHGVTYTAGATMFPQNINLAASFNKDLVRRSSEISAYETRASGIPWNFAPVVDLGADPRFPRQWETFGEDPFLTTELGKASLEGLQGTAPQQIGARHIGGTLKHFIAYQTTFSGKDRTPSWLSEQALREYHLPAFKAAIDAGVSSIMISSGIINGVPVHADQRLLTRLLREELKFEGVVVTDWGDIEALYRRDRVAADNKEAIRIAINAGIDMSMVPYSYERFCTDLIQLVKEGAVSMARINESVGRILKMKYKLDLFRKPLTLLKDYPQFGSKEFDEVAYRSAVESITLLKNEGNILPLRKGTKVLVAGPNAHSMRTLNGGWTYSWQGNTPEQFSEKYHTILEATRAENGEENTVYFPGVSYNMAGKYYEEQEDQFQEALKAAKEAEVIVLCLGENSYAETPGNLNDLHLSALQVRLALALKESGKPMVLVLNEGRPRVIQAIDSLMEAVVQIYLPGNQGGSALAGVLFGKENPSGKLPYTYPRYPNAVITYYHKPSEERKTVEGAYNYDSDYYPQYKFGYGLSYTSFQYDGLALSRDTMGQKDQLVVTVNVTNTGSREGKEVVLLYISDLVASITPDVKRLRAFEKISLKPGETRKVRFELGAADLAFVDASLQRITERGRFSVEIAGLKKEFFYQ